MSRWEEIHDILVRCTVDHVDFSALDPEERIEVQNHIANFLGRYYAKEDAVMNIAGLNLVETPEFLVGTLRHIADNQFIDEQAMEVGMARSFYHEIQMMLARIEGATGLDLTNPDGFFAAYDSYWETTQAIIKEVRKNKASVQGEVGAGT